MADAYRTFPIRDIKGFSIGNWSDRTAGTGCTVIVAPDGATAGSMCAAAHPPRARPICSNLKTRSIPYMPSAYPVARHSDSKPHQA